MTNSELFKSEHEWLEERTILLTTIGSRAYGTSDDNSDLDYRGICIPPADRFIERYNEYNTTGGKVYKNTKDDIDVSIPTLIKFANDAMMGVPNNIEMLFVRPEDHVIITPLGRELVLIRELFLSKQVKNKFGGYTNNMITELTKTRSKPELEHGYDTKKFMHAVRMLTSATEILNTGTYSTYRPDRLFLLDCKKGKLNFDAAIELIKYLDSQMVKAHDKSDLPEKPDSKLISTKVMSIIVKSFDI